MKFLLTTASGLAQSAKKECELLGYSKTQVVAGGIVGECDELGIARINLRSRLGNKLFILLTNGTTTTFDQLFVLIQTIRWENYVQSGMHINIQVHTYQSKLHSVPTLQSIVQKAIFKQLVGEGQRKTEKNALSVDIFVTLEYDQAFVYINSSGNSLHERGRRKKTGGAPLKEHLASGLVFLCGRKYAQPLLDPFCGSGTIVIEAAMIARNIAPGLQRSFAFEHRKIYPKDHLITERQQARQKILHQSYQIKGSDIDPTMLEIAQFNAQHAGVSDTIDFSVKNALEYDPQQLRGYLITNPPYGERLTKTDTTDIHVALIGLFEKNSQLKGGILTSYNLAEYCSQYGRKHVQLKNGPLDVTLRKRL